MTDNNPYKPRFSHYAENQCIQYDSASLTRTDAERQVAANYRGLAATSGAFTSLMLREYAIRIDRNVVGDDQISTMSFLKFGCGLGRSMEAISEKHSKKIDNADISAAMLSHTKTSPQLSKSLEACNAWDTESFIALCSRMVEDKHTLGRVTVKCAAENLEMIFAENNSHIIVENIHQALEVLKS